MKTETENFSRSDSDYSVQGSKVYVYNTANNINYLANENILDLAVLYGNNLGRVKYNKDQASNYRYGIGGNLNLARGLESDAEYFESESDKNKTELLHLLDSLNINNVGGIWAFNEIKYKKYIYRCFGGPYVRRKLYLFSKSGDSKLLSREIDFDNDIFSSILSLTNTQYDNDSELIYEYVRKFSITFLVALFFAFLVWCYKRDNAKRKAKEEKDKAEMERIAKEREDARLKAQKDWEKLLEGRAKSYGCLTKQISIGGIKENNIYVYEESRTIFILGNKYIFSDIVSCNIEKYLRRKGKTTQTTTPDKFEMAEQQVLWGMGKKYNVKSTTRIEHTPDIYGYTVYIGINSISHPQIQFSLSSIDVANEICNLINVIVNISK